MYSVDGSAIGHHAERSKLFNVKLKTGPDIYEVKNVSGCFIVTYTTVRNDDFYFHVFGIRSYNCTRPVSGFFEIAVYVQIPAYSNVACKHV